MCVYEYVHVNVCIYTYIYHIYIYIFTRIYIYIYAYVWVYFCCNIISRHTHTHTYTQYLLELLPTAIAKLVSHADNKAVLLLCRYVGRQHVLYLNISFSISHAIIEGDKFDQKHKSAQGRSAAFAEAPLLLWIFYISCDHTFNIHQDILFCRLTLDMYSVYMIFCIHDILYTWYSIYMIFDIHDILYTWYSIQCHMRPDMGYTCYILLSILIFRYTYRGTHI
jgi:hypothetical protein